MGDTYSPPSYADRIRGASLWRRLALVGLGVVVSVAAAIVAGVFLLDYPTEELAELAGILFLTAIGSLAVGGVLLGLLGERTGKRIAARLITAHIIGILVVLVIVGVSAMMLFDSSHDFELLGLLLAFAVAIAAIYSAFVSGWFTTSIGDLAAASQRLAEGDLSIRVPASGEQEFADLGGAMNTLAGRLQFAYQRQQALEESQRYLLAAVITELQEPLASLDRGLESLARGNPADSSSVQRISTSLQRDLNDQFRLLGHLESLAQIEAGKSPSQAETLNLSAAVIASVERFSPQASMLGVRLFPRVDFASPPVVADPVQLSIILDHLIEQAVRKEDSGGAVLIETLGRGHEVQVNVANSGSLAGNRQVNRTVGLIITRRLIELNGGRVWTAQPLTGGAVTSFTLPIASAQFSD